MEPSIVCGIQKGFLNQVRFLIEFGYNVNECDSEGRSPLVAVVLVKDQSWRASLARQLLEKGARVGIRDCRGLNAMHHACIYERPGLVKLYLNAVDYNLNQKDKMGNTALHYAAASGNQKVVKLLLEQLNRYKLPTDIPNKDRMTPLMYAWKCGHLDCAMLLQTLGNPNMSCRDATYKLTAREWEDAVKENLGIPRTVREKPEVRWEVTRAKSADGSRSSMTPSPDVEIYPIEDGTPTRRFDRAKTAHPRSRTDSNKQRSTVSTPTAKSPFQDPLFIKTRSFDAREESLVSSKQLKKKPIKNAEEDFKNQAEYLFHVCHRGDFLRDKTEGRFPRSRPKTVCVEHVEEDDEAGWRVDIHDMYASNEYQFSDSYRPPVKTSYPADQLRPGSANASEYLSDTMSWDLGGSQRRLSRRPSIVSTKGDKPKKLGGKNAPSVRKMGQLTANILRAFPVNVDTSSGESMSSSRHKTRKLASNVD